MLGVVQTVTPSISTPTSSYSGDFDALYRAEFASTAVIAGTTAGNRLVGEDIAQDAFEQAAAKWAEVSQLDRPGAWVRRVAINLAVSRRRRFAAEARAILRFGAHDDAPDPAAERFGRPDLWRAVARLSPRQRAVIALRYLDGYSVSEIADTLEITVSATTSHLHDARRRLANELGGHDQ